MDSIGRFLDRSDDIRNELENDDPLSDIDSVHLSDIGSEVGEELEQELQIELEEDIQSDENYLYVEENGNLEDNVYENESQQVEENNHDEHFDDPSEMNENENEESDWRLWSDSDVSFTKFVYLNESGFKPPRGTIPQTELEYFQLFFTDNLITEIINETNRYAKEKIQKSTPLRKRSVWWSWQPITLQEMKAFFGLLINMGMNPKPEIDDYFSNDVVDYQPFFKSILSKQRFQQIFWSLHVSPPHNGPVGGVFSRSGKVRRVILYLDRKFRQYYVPTDKISVDESTVGFKGKVIFKVYNKDKPIKWGIKIFVASESSTGYICGLEPYLGKQSTDAMDRQDLGVTSRVVLHLVKKLQDDYGSVEGMHVFTDRFYTNVDLAEALHDMKVHITGTIMRQRKRLPPEVRPIKKKKVFGKKAIRGKTKPVKPLKLKRGEMKAYRKDDKYSLLIWKDVNEVSMLSTYYDNSVETVRRIKKKGVVENVTKPTVVCRYNENMGGVDIADQYISTYAFIRKSIKWWRKVFFWLLEAAIVNAFILFNSQQPQNEKVRQRTFRKQLVKQLVGQVRNVSKRARPSDVEEEERLNGKLHLMYPLDERKTKDCIVCSDRSAGGVRKRSKFFCKTCENQPGLCAGVCFEKYHTLKDFKA